MKSAGPLSETRSRNSQHKTSSRVNDPLDRSETNSGTFVGPFNPDENSESTPSPNRPRNNDDTSDSIY